VSSIHKSLNPGTLARGFRRAYPPTPRGYGGQEIPPLPETKGDEMRRATIATMDNGLPVQCLSERDFLFPDADEKYMPDVLAYIQSYGFKTFNTLLWTKTPEEVVATFPYLSDREKSFACRALFDQWTKCLAEGWRGLPPHLME
jgi:hypothetical protein